MELVQIYLICFKKITITTYFFNLNLYIFLLNFLFWIRNRIQERKWIRIRVHCPGSKYINAVWSGHESVGCHYVPNAFLMSCLLFLGTFLISSTLKSFKTGSLFPTVVRWMANCVKKIILCLTLFCSVGQGGFVACPRFLYSCWQRWYWWTV